MYQVSKLIACLSLTAIVSCEPIAVDLRSIDPVDPIVEEPKSRVSICEFTGHACASEADLRIRFGYLGCPEGLEQYPLPCTVESEPANDLICCGMPRIDERPPPLLSPCEQVGHVCVEFREAGGTCHPGMEPRPEFSCDNGADFRPSLLCCAVIPPPERSACETKGFRCEILPEEIPKCSDGLTMQPYECLPDPINGDRTQCCG